MIPGAADAVWGAPPWGGGWDWSLLWSNLKRFSEIAAQQGRGAGLQPWSITTSGLRDCLVLFVWLWPRHSEVTCTPEHSSVLFWLFNYDTRTVSFLKPVWCSRHVVLDLLHVWLEQNARAICHEAALGSPCPKIKKPWHKQKKKRGMCLNNSCSFCVVTLKRLRWWRVFVVESWDRDKELKPNKHFRAAFQFVDVDL